jgi:hypothetical protein
MNTNGYSQGNLQKTFHTYDHARTVAIAIQRWN